MSVVQLGLAAIVGLIGIVVAQALKLDLAVSIIVGIVGAAAGHVGAGVLIPAESSVSAPVSTKGAAAKKDKSATKAKKEPKQEKDNKGKAKQEAKEKAEQAEQAEKAEKAKKKKKSAKDEPAPAPAAAAGKKGKAAPVKVVEPEESEEEEVEEEAPKSKSAIKKAKAKAAALKKEAEEKAAAIAAAAAAAAQAAANAAAQAAQAAAGGKKKKKKAVTEEKEAPKQTQPTKQEKAALEEGEWETPSAKKSEKNKERAKAKADAAKALAAQPITQEEGSSLVTAEISVDNLGALIGTGGETLKLIQTATGCTITTPKRDTGSKIVKISGPDAESVQRCRANIESLVTRGFSSVTHPGQIQDDIFISQDKIGVIVGPGGHTLKTLQNTTGTKINMPEKTSTTSRATITGAKEAVKAAKAAIKSLMQDGFSPLTHPGWEKVELAFPKEKLGILIGPKGHTIKSIQGNTQTRINIPGRDSPADQNVSVVGTTAGIAQAVKEINRLLEPIGGYAPDDDEWVQDNEEAEGQWGIRSTAAQGEEALWD